MRSENQIQLQAIKLWALIGIARSCSLAILSYFYINTNLQPDSSRIALRVGRDGLMGWIKNPRFASKDILYALSGITTYPPTQLEVLKYCALDSLILGLWCFAFLNKIKSIDALNTNKKALTPAVIIIYCSPGLAYLTFTLRSEWGALLLILLILHFSSKQLTQKLQWLTLAITSLFYKSVSIAAIFYAYLTGAIEPREYNWKSLLILYLKNCIFYSALLLLITLITNGSFWHNSYYSATALRYTGPREWFNIYDWHDIWKLIFKIPLSYFLDTRGITIVPSEDSNSLAAIQRLCCILIIVFNFQRNSKTSNFRNWLIALYITLTAPIIAFTGFYQSRYLIPFDCLLILRTCLVFQEAKL